MPRAGAPTRRAPRSSPDFSHETALSGLGMRRVAGIDEAGRGPLAGPVVAAAVILDPENIPEGLNDSKMLSAKRRVALFDCLTEAAQVGVGRAEVEEIDRINILQASHLAMMRALAALPERPDHALIDGRQIPREINLPATGIVRGDATCLCIAAASIIAKVTRDRIMWDLAQQFPGYGWETNQGYPSKSHRLALRNLGITPHHRRSFKPVHNILYQDNSINR